MSNITMPKSRMKRHRKGGTNLLVEDVVEPGVVVELVVERGVVVELVVEVCPKQAKQVS